MFDTFQETSETLTLNGEYENFMTTTIKTTAGCIPNKSRAKCSVPWESVAVRGKGDNVNEASLLNKRNIKNTKLQKT